MFKLGSSWHGTLGIGSHAKLDTVGLMLLYCPLCCVVENSDSHLPSLHYQEFFFIGVYSRRDGDLLNRKTRVGLSIRAHAGQLLGGTCSQSITHKAILPKDFKKQ